MTIFDHTHCTEKLLNQFLAFLKSYQHEKNHFIPSFHFWDTVSFRVPNQTGHTHFWPCPSQKFLVSFLFLWSCINMQKISFYHLFILQIQSILESHQQLATPIFDHAHLIKFNYLLICVKLYKHAKNQLTQSVHSWDTANIRTQRPDWPHLFLTIPNQKLFNQIIIFVNLYQHAKN